MTETSFGLTFEELLWAAVTVNGFDMDIFIYNNEHMYLLCLIIAVFTFVVEVEVKKKVVHVVCPLFTRSYLP